MVRREIHLQYAAPDGVLFKLADTEEELRGALHLLHDSYVNSGLMKPHFSGMRATVYHALPTTSTLIAKKDDVVIGTVSMIRNNPLGLPLEKIFDLSKIKSRTSHVTEISSLAIHPQFRGNKGLFFLLTKYLMEYSLRYYHVDYWVIAINPKHYQIYKDIFLFDDLETSSKSYDFVEGAPALGLYVNLNQLKVKFFEMYSKCPTHQDLFSFYFNPILTLPFFFFPNRTFHKAMDPVLTPSIFKKIFIEDTGLISSLTDSERELLQTAYSSAPKFLELFPQKNLRRVPERRRTASRFSFMSDGYLQPIDEGLIIPMKVTSVSEHGFSAELMSDIKPEVGANYFAKIKVGPFNVEEAFVKTCWAAPNKTAGFEIIGQSNAWNVLISQLLKELRRTA